MTLEEMEEQNSDRETEKEIESLFSCGIGKEDWFESLRNKAIKGDVFG